MTDDARAEEQRKIREKRDAEEARRRSLREQRLCGSCSTPVTDAALALGLCPRCGKKLSVVLAPAQPVLPLSLDPQRSYKAPDPEPEAPPAEPHPEDEAPDPTEPSCRTTPPSNTSSTPSSGASGPTSSRRGKHARRATPADAPVGDLGGALLANGYPDYGGPHPALVIDVHRESRRPAPGPDLAAEPRAAEARQVVERRVTGYAHTKVAMTFHMGGGSFEDLDAGTVVELLDPSARDQKDLDHWERVGRQHVVIRWRGGVALVLGKDIVRTDVAAWRLQEDRRKASPC